MYSLLNGDTYSNDQKQSVLKFRINPRPQKQQRKKKKKVQKQKGSKRYSQDQSLWYASSLLTAFLCHRHATFLPSFYFTGSPSLIAMEYPKEEKKGRAKDSAISPAWKRLKSLERRRKNQCGHNRQQQPTNLNPSEQSASQEPLCNWRTSIYFKVQCPAQYKPRGYKDQSRNPSCHHRRSGPSWTDF